MAGAWRSGERLHHARDDAGAAHVHRHLFHAAGGLDRDAAGVEDDALADQRERPGVAAALPLHHHDLGRAVRPLPHREQRPHPELLELGLLQHLDLDAERPELLEPAGELGGGEDVRGLADEVAGEVDPGGLGRERREGGLRGFRVAHDEADGAVRLRRILLAGAVVVEGVGLEVEPLGDLGDPRLVAAEHGERHGGVEAGDRGAGEARLGRRGAFRQLDDLNRLRREARRMREEMAAPGLGLAEGVAADEAGDGALAQPVHLPRQGVERVGSVREHGDPPLDSGDFGALGGNESGLQWRGHDALHRLR